MCCNFVNTLFSRHERGATVTGLAIGSIKARDGISEVVVVIAFRTRLLDTFVLVLKYTGGPRLTTEFRSDDAS